MNIKFGNRRIIGQSRAKEQVERMLASDRISHAYLLSGPSGVGKTAFALAFAEAINGIDHLSDLGEYKASKKSSWFTHPDIHVFIPKPTSAKTEELRDRLELLSKDPYEIIDFSQRPSLDDESSKNLQAFYPIDYFRDDIRPIAKLKPNEGNRVVIILTHVETMRKETANAFLKLLEEPSDRLMFILTTESYESLLPTITSRCQHIPLGALKAQEVEQGLIDVDGLEPEAAAYLARVSNGNYAMTRFFDVSKLKENRESVVEYLRMAFSQDANGLSTLVQDWQSSQNIEGLIAMTNLIEMYIRDLMVYRETGEKKFITNIDQLESIQKFVKALDDARLEEMITHLDEFRPALRQNVNPKLIFIVLALRFSTLMRGLDPIIPDEENWKHVPAFVE
ncbi:MAG: AAA family ATPase [Gracilimonas sp.]|uniref:DNA polymerase III subunit n=1 Tax=Gracilimonas TaxID=649462 RepID=UPI001AFEA013|nr:DNA polymerase III subunit delta' C-terminal domain-containing protein [Gracilimonas sp.]MBO6586706.1 AAA family ATPase [Gracilimonas sp.]MBO6615363.1 AAA family ATPase [Gracilimonas sp.]